eukprot:1867435-Rhodomonas_salina.1
MLLCEVQYWHSYAAMRYTALKTGYAAMRHAVLKIGYAATRRAVLAQATALRGTDIQVTCSQRYVKYNAVLRRQDNPHKVRAAKRTRKQIK